jgi:ABC-type branched-subunit amino acid transport system substrate-binding protein
VNGNTFTLVRRDDGGRAEDTVGATQELLATSRPLVLTGYFGNRNVANVVSSGLLQGEKIAIVGYRSWEVPPETPFLYNVRADLREELGRLTEHLATIGVTRLGLLYEAGPGATELLLAARESAKKAGAQLVAQASYPPGTARMAGAIEPFTRTPPQAIIVVATGAAAAGFIEQYREAGGTAQVFAHSAADVEQMAKRLSDDQLKGVAIAQVTPSPYRISTRVARELHDLLGRTEKPGVPVSYAMMEGFITAKVIVEAVRRLGRAPSREGFVAAIESIDNFDVGGFNIGFRSGKHVGSRFVELSIVGEAGKIRQ